jgi:hypothetical protein
MGDCRRLRGKLDVSKERFVSIPGCERLADPTPVVAWAGWDDLQQAQALAAYYVRMQEQEAWPLDRLVPLLAGLLELVPWLKQWHWLSAVRRRRCRASGGVSRSRVPLGMALSQ